MQTICPEYAHMNAMQLRLRINSMVDQSLISQAKLFEEAIFMIGLNQENYTPTVHSEPPIKEDRILLEIMPGSKKELEKLMQYNIKNYDLLNCPLHSREVRYN